MLECLFLPKLEVPMSKYSTKMYARRCLSKLVCEESEHTSNQESYLRKAPKYSRIVFLELQNKKKKRKKGSWHLRPLGPAKDGKNDESPRVPGWSVISEVGKRLCFMN